MTMLSRTSRNEIRVPQHPRYQIDDVNQLTKDQNDAHLAVAPTQVTLSGHDVGHVKWHHVVSYRCQCGGLPYHWMLLSVLI